MWSSFSGTFVCEHQKWRASTQGIPLSFEIVDDAVSSELGLEPTAYIARPVFTANCKQQ